LQVQALTLESGIGSIQRYQLRSVAAASLAQAIDEDAFGRQSRQ